MTSLLRRCKPYLILLPFLALGLWNAYSNSFMQDAAYISFNYAKWYAQGHGLVWYPGSQEFTYHNFLYSFIIALGMLLGGQPEIISNTINIACFIGSIVLVYHMALRLLGHRWLALLPVLLLVTDHSFTAYATGGVETMWVTFLTLLFYRQILTRARRAKSTQQLWLGTLATILLLSWPASIFLILPGYIFTLIESRLREAVIIPAIVMPIFWLCSYFTYGLMFPHITSTPGLQYLVLYNMAHLYLPFLVPFFLLYFSLKLDSYQKFSGFSMLMAMVVVLWLGFIALAGGDDMEFRLMVPVLAFYYLGLMSAVIVLLRRHRTAMLLAMTALFLCGNAVHPALFGGASGLFERPQKPKPFDYARVESTDSLSKAQVMNTQTGKALHMLFNDAQDVKIAASIRGALAYYSGLNVLPADAPDASLNLAYPQLICHSEGRYSLVKSPLPFNSSERHETLLLPLDEACFVIADYVNPHPKIDELLKKKVILRHRDIEKESNCPRQAC